VQVLEGLVQHKFSNLMAQIVVWLQQRPEVTTEQAACSAASISNSSSSCGDVSSSSGSSSGGSQDKCYITTLWSACMTSLGKMICVLADYTREQPCSATPHAEHMASSLESAGGEHDLRCFLYSGGQDSNST
jgi:hypothetical protein